MIHLKAPKLPQIGNVEASTNFGGKAVYQALVGLSAAICFASQRVTGVGYKAGKSDTPWPNSTLPVYQARQPINEGFARSAVKMVIVVSQESLRDNYVLS